jgi:hypothetical protein
MNRSLVRILALAAFVLAARPAFAQGGCGTDGQIQTRADLLARLGPNATLEGFESYSIASGSADNLNLPCLDDTSIANGQGPGLVQPGALYCDPSGNTLQWNGDQYYQLTTQTILSNGAGTIRITYTQPVAAMGVDLLGYIGYPYSGTATVYDTASNVVGTVNFSITTGGSERFFVGWANAAGIGSVEIASSAFFWSPLIDDHAYGNCSGSVGGPYCFGDGIDPLVTTSCPCSNFGAAGRGCANALNAQGARLTGSGSTNPDTAQLTSAGELSSSLSIFLQGTATNNGGLLFGDGVRCVTGLLRRLYVHNASGGSVSAPSGSDLSITARSAQLGDPLLAGAVRYYQVYYRDPHLGFCTGAGYNASNALPIHW